MSPQGGPAGASLARDLLLRRRDLSQTHWPDPVSEPDVKLCLQPVLDSLRTAEAGGRDFLRLAFNHTGNDGRSLLTSIDSIDEKYVDLMVALMQALCEGLAGVSDANLAPVAQPILRILSRNPRYLEQQPLLRRRLTATDLVGGNTQLHIEAWGINPERLEDNARLAIEALQDDATGAAFATHYSMAIYQVLYALENPPEDLQGGPPALRARRRELAQDLARVYDSRLPEWLRRPLADSREADDEPYFALLAADRPTAVLLHHDYFKSLVLAQPLTPAFPQGPTSYAWSQAQELDHRRLAAGNKRSGLAPQKLLGRAVDKTALQPFPLLRDTYARDAAVGQLGKLVEALGLNEDDSKWFREAITDEGSRVKLCSPEDQARLVAVFDRLTTGQPDIVLESRHLRRIAAIYTDPERDALADTELAHVLLWLAAAFVNYSSAAMFGEEEDSPQGVRSYALALINTVMRLDASYLPPATAGDWIGKLTGKAYPCTGQLYLAMVPALRKLDTATGRPLGDEMLPQKWRPRAF